MVAMPNILLFQLILPIFAPIADLTLLLGLLTGTWTNVAKIVVFYLLFMLIDLICSIVAFHFEGKPLGRLWLMFPQRIVYRPLMYSVLFKSYRKALKGELQNWLNVSGASVMAIASFAVVTL